MTKVLPPRFGGVLACLKARPDLEVVVVAHAGLDRITSGRQAFDALPFCAPMTVRMWPAAKAPDTDEDRKAWLTAEWAVVDEWIDRHHAHPLGAGNIELRSVCRPLGFEGSPKGRSSNGEDPYGNGARGL